MLRTPPTHPVGGGPGGGHLSEDEVAVLGQPLEQPRGRHLPPVLRDERARLLQTGTALALVRLRVLTGIEHLPNHHHHHQTDGRSVSHRLAGRAGGLATALCVGRREWVSVCLLTRHRPSTLLKRVSRSRSSSSGSLIRFTAQRGLPAAATGGKGRQPLASSVGLRSLRKEGERARQEQTGRRSHGWAAAAMARHGKRGREGGRTSSARVCRGWSRASWSRARRWPAGTGPRTAAASCGP